MSRDSLTDPLLVTPRLDSKPWGGRRLADFGIDLGGRDDVGEAVLTSNDVIVTNGPHANQTLGDLIARDPDGLLGPTGAEIYAASGEFPLLIKLIDAHQNLSIQVHPTNETAPAGCVGKTEAWYILDAEPGATLYAGLKPGVTRDEVRKCLAAGESMVSLVRTLAVQPGDVVFLPAGTIHALGAGVVLYEIQQPSTITYRLEDWGRAREMHIEQGLAVLDDRSRPQPTRPERRTSGSRSRPAVECAYFSFELVVPGPGDEVWIPAEGGPQVFTCVSGSAALCTTHARIDIRTGETAVLFAGAGESRIAGVTGTRVLRGWVPGQGAAAV
jgi:mannose-6-phosphate isomerase